MSLWHATLALAKTESSSRTSVAGKLRRQRACKRRCSNGGFREHALTFDLSASPRAANPKPLYSQTAFCKSQGELQQRDGQIAAQARHAQDLLGVIHEQVSCLKGDTSHSHGTRLCLKAT